MAITEEVKMAVDKYDYVKNVKLEKALSDYKDMVKSGIAKPRGNRLLPIEEKQKKEYNYISNRW